MAIDTLTQKYETCILEKETDCRKVTNFRCQEYLEQLIGQTTWIGITQKVKWTALKYWMLISLIAHGYVTTCNATYTRQKYKQMLDTCNVHITCQYVKNIYYSVISILSTAYRNANWKWFKGKPFYVYVQCIMYSPWQHPWLQKAVRATDLETLHKTLEPPQMCILIILTIIVILIIFIE